MLHAPHAPQLCWELSLVAQEGPPNRPQKLVQLAALSDKALLLCSSLGSASQAAACGLAGSP